MTTPLNPRQQEILDRVRRDKQVRVDELAEAFHTTPQTIRKDLQVLAELHLVVRFHGGAALIGGVAYADIDARRLAAAGEKVAIGQAVARLIPGDCTVFINAGTTTEQAVAALDRQTRRLLLVDNVDLAASARRLSASEVVIPGGRVRSSDGAIYGAEAVDFIRRFSVDYAVIGAAALDESGGLLDFDFDEVEVCRAIVAQARHVVLAIDSGKFLRPAPMRFASLEQVHTLVTDGDAPPAMRELCERFDVELVIANDR